jgi:hypothetical protein
MGRKETDMNQTFKTSSWNALSPHMKKIDELICWVSKADPIIANLHWIGQLQPSERSANWPAPKVHIFMSF